MTRRSVRYVHPKADRPPGTSAGDIQLGAIGICHPVEQYYARSMTINALEELDGALLQLIEQLLCEWPPTLEVSQAVRC
jgi:hypothetical protein